MVQVPILRQGDAMIVSIQESLTDSDMLDLQHRILQELVRNRANGVIIDVSALDVLDSFATRTLCDIAATVHMRGARTVVVGIQPEVALSMVLLGLTLNPVDTALDLDAGLTVLRKPSEPTNAR
jgi:rsbT antagonist protein RsbS